MEQFDLAHIFGHMPHTHTCAQMTPMYIRMHMLFMY